MNQLQYKPSEITLPETNSLCSNCRYAITENFCPNCGQKRYKRIDKEYLWLEVQDSVFQVNKGFFYTLFNIIKNPGKTARSFIEGQRVVHYKPILLAFVLGGISTFISFAFLNTEEMLREVFASNPNIDSRYIEGYLSIWHGYGSLIMLSSLPIFALFTSRVFRKWGQNYWEHVVMNAYIYSFYTLISSLVMSPVFYFLRDDSQMMIAISNLLWVLAPFILVWFYRGFYKDKTLKNICMKILVLMGWFVVVGIGAFILAILAGILMAVMGV